MIAKDFIEYSIPYLKPTDTIGYALDIFQNNKIDALSIVDNNKFLGNITENILLEIDENILLKNISQLFLDETIFEYQHLFDILKKYNQNSIFSLAVLSKDKEFLGNISIEKIIQFISNQTLFSDSGGILVIEILAKDYSLSHLSKITESNNASIIGLMINKSLETDKLIVSLKINKNDLKEIQLAFERHNYEVVAVFHQSEYELYLQDRLESLIKYLEV